jgi:hypothetical protein
LHLRELADTAQQALARIDRLANHLDARLDPLVADAQGALATTTQTLRAADDACNACSGKCRPRCTTSMHCWSMRGAR